MVRNCAALSCKYFVLFRVFKYGSESEMNYEYTDVRMFAISVDRAGGWPLIAQQRAELVTPHIITHYVM